MLRIYDSKSDLPSQAVNPSSSDDDSESDSHSTPDQQKVPSSSSSTSSASSSSASSSSSTSSSSSSLVNSPRADGGGTPIYEDYMPSPGDSEQLDSKSVKTDLNSTSVLVDALLAELEKRQTKRNSEPVVETAEEDEAEEEVPVAPAPAKKPKSKKSSVNGHSTASGAGTSSISGVAAKRKIAALVKNVETLQKRVSELSETFK